MKTPKRYTNATIENLPPELREKLGDAAQNHTSVYLHGAVGTGKTYAIWAFAHLLKEDEYQIWNVSELLRKLRPTDGSYDPIDVQEMAAYRRFLVLDDIGVEKPSEWVLETIYGLLNFRYENELPTILTSNLSLGELSAKLGERIASRLAEMCEVLELKGEDKRLYK